MLKIYGKLVDENGHVLDSDKERVSYILNELNSALGTEYELNGDIIEVNGKQVGSYQQLQEELNKTIEARKREIQQEADLELYKEAYKTRRETQIELTKKLNERAEAQKELTELEKKGVSQTDETYKKLKQKIGETDIAIEDLRQINKDATSDMTFYWTEAYGSISSDMLDMSDANSIALQTLLSNNYTAWDEAYGKLDESQKETMLIMSSTIENWTPELDKKWQELAQTGSDEFKKAYEIMKTDTTGFSTEAVKTVKTMPLAKEISTVAKNAVSDFSKNFKFSDFLPGRLKDISNSIDREQTNVRTSVQGITNTVQSGLNVDMGGYGVGSNLVKGIAQGINAEKKGTFLLTSMTGLAATIGSKIKNLLGIRSPSRVMRDEVGKFIPLGIAEGIDMEASSVSDSMKELSERIKVDSEGFNSYLNPSFNPNINSDFTSKMQMDNDMAQGFEEATYNAMTKAISESMNNQEISPRFDVHIGDDKVYSGYSTYQDKESNRYGVKIT